MTSVMGICAIYHFLRYPSPIGCRGGLSQTADCGLPDGILGGHHLLSPRITINIPHLRLVTCLGLFPILHRKQHESYHTLLSPQQQHHCTSSTSPTSHHSPPPHKRLHQSPYALAPPTPPRSAADRKKVVPSHSPNVRTSNLTPTKDAHKDVSPPTPSHPSPPGPRHRNHFGKGKKNLESHQPRCDPSPSATIRSPHPSQPTNRAPPPPGPPTTTTTYAPASPPP